MSARAISNGTISFGLVTIPVKLYSTGESAVGIHFNMVHKECGTQVKQRKDASQQFTEGGRAELAAKEDAEAAILQAYLPEQLSEDEVKAIVTETVKEIGFNATLNGVL